jgi:hypothetical protein
VATTQWKLVVPFQDTKGINYIVNLNIERINLMDLHYYALIYSAMPYFVYARFGTTGLANIPRSRLIVKGKALQLLQHELSACGDGDIPDHIFSIMIALAFQEVNYDTLHIKPPSYPRSPLSDYQALSTAGYRRVEPAHAAYMYRTVLQRGLHRITPTGTQFVLAM